MTHVMVDLETWGLTPGSDIRSIGAVVFDPVAGTLGEEFYVNLENPDKGDWDSLNLSDETRYWDATSKRFRKYPLTRDPETTKWWSDQSEAAQAVLTTNPVDLKHGLIEFLGWLDRICTTTTPCITDMTQLRLWAHGPQFDEVLLVAACSAVGLKVNWSHRAPRDCRTIWEAAGGIDIPFEGTPHYALDDAKHQARCVIEAYRRLGIGSDYDRRVTELLAANNREVERRRAAEALLRKHGIEVAA